ncbi:kmo [Symbiodinium sp. CCMP2456]|nr:kmo [Symbiodinium sp. CCMP2456]
MHNCSPMASIALGRSLMATALLANGRDEGENLQMRIQGTGPIGTIITEASSALTCRGMVGYPSADAASVPELVGMNEAATLRLTRTHPFWKRPYTGTIALRCGEIAEDVVQYLAMSEQTPASMGLSVEWDAEAGCVKAAEGWLVTLLPGWEETEVAVVETNIKTFPNMDTSGSSRPDAICQHMMRELRGEFQAEQTPTFRCPCSKSRLATAVMMLGKEEVLNIIEEKENVEAKCDWCGTPHVLTPEEEISVGGQGHVIILGAGLVGSLCAVVLLQKGFKVHLFERYQDIRSIPSAGRSINLSVTSRGLRAIKALGGTLYSDIIANLTTKVMGRIIHMPDGKAIFQRYGKDNTEHNYSVSRLDLNKFLLNAAADAGAELHFDHGLLESSDFLTGGSIGSCLHFKRGTGFLKVHADCPVIACDGAGSRVRYALRRCGLTEFTEDLLTRGYKEVLFPKPEEGREFGATGEHGEACDGRLGLHIWPRGDHMLMALANRDGSFTGTIYMDNQGEEEAFAAFTDTPEGRAKCSQFCEKYYSDAIPHVGGLESLVNQIVKNPTGILGTVRATKWTSQGKVLLIGDSCHAMVPFFGQGCNCGFEDTLWLSKLIDSYCCDAGKVSAEKCTGENFAACFAAVEAERKPSADAICEMALENFLEMRDKTGDVKFQVLKKVENRLENVFPDKFRSRYAMVCYGGEGNVSYANAKDLGIVQASILEKLWDSSGGIAPEQVNSIELDEAEKLIDQLLVPRQKELGIDLSTIKH